MEFVEVNKLLLRWNECVKSCSNLHSEVIRVTHALTTLVKAKPMWSRVEVVAWQHKRLSDSAHVCLASRSNNTLADSSLFAVSLLGTAPILARDPKREPAAGK